MPTGPEALQGSTRMKAGTATKMVLNMITTSVMALCGKIYKNYMVDVKATNLKLRGRAARLTAELGQTDMKTAEKLLKEADYNVKESIVMARKNINREKAAALLFAQKGFLQKILD